MNKSLIILFHTILVILAYSSPFWLDWKIFLICFALYWLQIIIFRGCVLTIAQFNGSEPGFVAYYLNRFFIKIEVNVSLNSIRFFVRKVLPFLLLAMALIFQLVFKVNAPVKLF